jgi:serine/threonine-protein kinase
VPAFSADLSGRTLGDFRLLRLLGQGAMAGVYLAEQVNLKRQVAVKVLKPELASDQTYVRRLQREAEAAAALSHANIVQIYDVGCLDGIYYIAQEYVQGLNLRQWMNRHGTADLHLAVSILRQVAAALAKAAEAGIVHRDIKPENIMLTHDGEVKVADFGLARFPALFGDTVELTQTGVTLGTPLYMSPEQVEGKPLDPRSDLYSLGVTCYHLLAGNPPFAGQTALSVAVQHLKKEPESLETLRPDLPPALCHVVHKLLAKQPDHRYPSARELQRDVHAIQCEHLGNQWPETLLPWDPGQPHPLLTAPSAATQRLDAVMRASTALGGRRSRWAGWLAAAVAAFGAGAAVAFFTGVERPLLANVEGHFVEPQKTVFHQWIYASQVGTEEAWQAVINNFPDRLYFVYRAKQQLARMYIHDDRLDEAMSIFRELAALEDTEAELQAYGLAGQCGVLSRQGKYHDSAQVLGELWPIRSQLKDPWMKQFLEYAVRTDHRKLGGDPNWKDWFNEHFPDAG